MKFLFSLLLLVLSTQVRAGSCCGGGASAVKLISGDNKAVYRMQVINRSLIADSNQSQKVISRSLEENESIESFIQSVSFKLSSLFQVGFELPIIKKTRRINNQWESLTGLGDIQLSGAWEAHPEFNRNQLINQGFLYSSITLPTSPSLFDTKRVDLLDTRGQGHHLFTLGALLKKKTIKHHFDLNLSLSLREARAFSNSLFGEDLKTKSSINNSISLTHAYLYSNSLSWISSIKRDFFQRQAGSIFINENQSSLVNTLGFTILYSQSETDFSLSYADDLILKNSQSSVLGKNISLGLTQRIDL